MPQAQGAGLHHCGAGIEVLRAVVSGRMIVGGWLMGANMACPGVSYLVVYMVLGLCVRSPVILLALGLFRLRC